LIWLRYPLKTGGGISDILTPDINWFQIVKWADPLSFRHFRDNYAVDRRYVYLYQRLDEFDVRTFRSMGNHFYCDKNNIRYGDGLIKKQLEPQGPVESFDPDTFQSVRAGIVKDRSGTFRRSGFSMGQSEFNKYWQYDMNIDVYVRIES